MADIASELNAIYRASLGEFNRMPIHDALKAINDEVEEKKSSGGDDNGGHSNRTGNNS